MPIDNPFFAQILAQRLMDEHHRRHSDAPIRYQVRELQRRASVLGQLRRAIRRGS